MIEQKKSRRDLLKGALALPLLGSVRATGGGAEAVPKVVELFNDVSPVGLQGEQPVYDGPSWATPVVRKLWDELAEFVYHRFEKRPLTVEPAHRCVVLAECLFCLDYDFAEHVNDLNGPIYGNVCDDCVANLPAVLTVIALEKLGKDE